MRDDELDRMIDAGLSTYAEPRAGLEQRVLAAVDAERRAPQGLKPRGLRESALLPGLKARPAGDRNLWPSWRMWAMGLAAAACLLIAVTVGVRVVEAPHSNGPQATNDTHAPVAHRAVQPEVRTETPVRVAAKRRVRRSDEAGLRRLPKKDVFPTPQPLSPEMRELVAYIAHTSEKERKELVEFQAQQDAPVRIPPIHMTPVDTSAAD